MRTRISRISQGLRRYHRKARDWLRRGPRCFHRRQRYRFRIVRLNQNEEITPPAADYRSAATITATAAKQGSTVEFPDCLISAVAVRLDRLLATVNTDPFEAIQRTGIKLTIENLRAEHA